MACEICAPTRWRGYGLEFRDLYLRQMLLTVNSIGKNESIRTDQMKFWSIRFSGRA
jgi:hypothetical protein